MQHSPPPLFKQGASALVKVVFFSVFSLALLLIDARMNSLVKLRQAVATFLYPVQMLAVVPRDTISGISNYFASTSVLEKELAALKQKQISQAETLHQNTFLATENVQLRKLLEIKSRTDTQSLVAEVIYDAHDAFTRKVILDKGLKHGVALSQPVIDDRGVVGQVTRVFPLTSEITLLTDKNQAIPVQVARNGLRSVIYGRGQSAFLDMRTTTNADVKKGDIVVTSGIDGIYPEGLQVAIVEQVENKATTTFENVLCKPAAGIDHHKQLLILLVNSSNLKTPETEETRTKKDKIIRRVTRDSLKENTKEAPNPAEQVKPDSTAIHAPVKTDAPASAVKKEAR